MKIIFYMRINPNLGLNHKKYHDMLKMCKNDHVKKDCNVKTKDDDCPLPNVWFWGVWFARQCTMMSKINYMQFMKECWSRDKNKHYKWLLN